MELGKFWIKLGLRCIWPLRDPIILHKRKVDGEVHIPDLTGIRNIGQITWQEL